MLNCQGGPKNVDFSRQLSSASDVSAVLYLCSYYVESRIVIVGSIYTRSKTCAAIFFFKIEKKLQYIFQNRSHKWVFVDNSVVDLFFGVELFQLINYHRRQARNFAYVTYILIPFDMIDTTFGVIIRLALVRIDQTGI